MFEVLRSICPFPLFLIANKFYKGIVEKVLLRYDYFGIYAAIRIINGK